MSRKLSIALLIGVVLVLFFILCLVWILGLRIAHAQEPLDEEIWLPFILKNWPPSILEILDPEEAEVCFRNPQSALREWGSVIYHGSGSLLATLDGQALTLLQTSNAGWDFYSAAPTPGPHTIVVTDGPNTVVRHFVAINSGINCDPNPPPNAATTVPMTVAIAGTQVTTTPVVTLYFYLPIILKLKPCIPAEPVPGEGCFVP